MMSTSNTVSWAATRELKVKDFLSAERESEIC